MSENKLSLRPLTPIETAFTKTNQHFPLNITVVLRILPSLHFKVIEQALSTLQERQCIFNLGIRQVWNGFRFIKPPEKMPVPLYEVNRVSDDTWKELATKWINTKIDIKGPLIHAIYISSKEEQTTCELILVFHHALVDSVSLRLILHEFLSLCAKVPLPIKDIKQDNLPEFKLVIPQLPGQFKGFSLVWHLFPFIIRQIVNELRFFRKGSSLPIPENSNNALINLNLSLEKSRKLVIAIARKGLSLNSVLGAAILLALVKRIHLQPYDRLFNAISFANIRPYFLGDIPENGFGSFISMIRFTLTIYPDSTVESIAQNLRQQMYKSGKAKEVLLYSIMSNALLSMALKMRKMRLGNSGLSFIGKLDLQSKYGNLFLKNVHAYISNNALGPEFSGLGKILFGRVELNFTYLTAELDKDQAEAIVKDIENQLICFSSEDLSDCK
jgi:NRPS condensation-like uncharacterized protein